MRIYHSREPGSKERMLRFFNGTDSDFNKILTPLQAAESNNLLRKQKDKDIL
ncbi:MAG: hypothetical protein UFG06_13620 [Lachnospiraceae bacterium]|nr:hypothetical protein [Lachnospiraceae bacterium]